jgi:hypothetical protein
VSGRPFSHLVRVERLPPGGKHFRVEARESERSAIAEALGIVGVAALAVDVDIRPLAGASIGVRGTVTASVVQTDVVTIEPLAQEMVEEIDVALSPAEATGRRREKAVTDAEPAEERDVYHNGQVDLGAIAVEHLAIGLDPYPRAAGVEFPGYIEDDPTAASSPFAALQRLKRDQE